jgi:hypothetical protein
MMIACALVGCAPRPVTVDLNFPNADAFMRSHQARLRVFQLDPSVDGNGDGTPDQLGICPELLAGLRTAGFSIVPVYDTGLHDVCEFRGNMPLPALDGGPHAFLVDVRSADDNIILRGCRIGEVYVDAPDIVVELHPTSEYAATTPLPGTPESRCRGGGM